MPEPEFEAIPSNYYRAGLAFGSDPMVQGLGLMVGTFGLTQPLSASGRSSLNSLDNAAPAASGIHPEYWASVSGEVNQHSLMRALRQSNTPEAQATAKLIKRGNVNLRLEPTDIYGQGAAGRQPYGTNDVILSLDKINDPASAAGFAAHETQHFLQKLTPTEYWNNALKYESEAYRWQRRVDQDFPLRDDFEVEQFLKDNPLYPMIE
ncbi:MAG: hypothetical protein AB2652_20135 [Candidatus Thiodiazotropha endolucinida]|uniref:Uncharacterized protein n=1 Tax=Candidatus Thiodiazotropha taylori TaxID=2792791 RepID=A0A9E4NH90_9GAMM|nr:hypothetical protein [Candidatus Thiodiazotropha taylori]MCW4235145.1 hypothetical protein [Candidatus Thiodiazotropha endolucinida]